MDEEMMLRESNDDAGVPKLPGRMYGMKYKLIGTAVLVVVALVSISLVAGFASSPDTYAGINATLDAKKVNVMALMSGATASSVGISALPDDFGMPLANQLTEISSNLAIVLVVIYLEKFLPTTLGYVSFTFLVPIACVLFAITLYIHDESKWAETLRRIGAKIALVALALVLVVPASVWVSDSIDKSFDASLTTSVASEQSSSEEATEESWGESASGESAEESGVFSGIVSTAQGIFDEAVSAVEQGAQDAVDAAQSQLNELIDKFAVMIVTSCVIPILVLIFFLWLVNLVTGISIPSSRVFGAAQKAGKPLVASAQSAVKKHKAPSE